MPILICEQDKSFYSLQRMDYQFLLRKRNFTGKELTTKYIPLFTTGYGSINEYCLSPDGKKIIYLKDNRKEENCFFLLDVENGKSTQLSNSIATSCVYVRFIRFLSNDTILFGVDDYNTKSVHISELNITTKEISLKYKPQSISEFNMTISNSKKYLAFCDELDTFDCIKIMDIRNGNIITTIFSESRKTIGDPCWNSDENLLGYSLGESIRIYNLATGTSKKIHSFPQDTIIYGLEFIDSNRLMCKYGFSGGKKAPLAIIDINSGKIIKNIKVNCDEFYIVDGGKKVIIEDAGFL